MKISVLYFSVSYKNHGGHCFPDPFHHRNPIMFALVLCLVVAAASATKILEADKVTPAISMEMIQKINVRPIHQNFRIQLTLPCSTVHEDHMEGGYPSALC